jgi:hypothetical protein
VEKETNRIGFMKAASILLALVVVLGIAREAGADLMQSVHNTYVISIGEQRFGFEDGDWIGWGTQGNWSSIYLGPLGPHRNPFTATQGLVGFCVIVAMLVIVPAVLTVRWKRRAAG